jgi:hypothetical protein
LKAILVRPKFDDPTEHTFNFAEEILQWCRQAGIDVIELAEDEAVRAKVEDMLKMVEDAVPGGIIYIHYDHGDDDALIGQDEKAVIDLDNAHLLTNKETYTLACLSGKELGPEVWRKGGIYWGYTEVVSFTTDALPEFQESFNCGFHYHFVEGNSHQDTLSRARETFSRLSYDLLGAGKTFAALAMRSNRDALVYLNSDKPGEEKEGCLLGLLKLLPRLTFRPRVSPS